MGDNRHPTLEEFRRLTGVAPSLPSLNEAKVYKEAEIDDWVMSVKKQAQTLTDEFAKKKAEWSEIRETIKEVGLHQKIDGLAKAIEGIDKVFMQSEPVVKKALPAIREFMVRWQKAWGELSKAKKKGGGPYAGENTPSWQKKGVQETPPSQA